MNYRLILKEHLRRRQEVNPRYSLRAFAKKLEISPSKVSEVLSGKKRLSVERAESLAKKLGLTGKEFDLFVISVQLESTSKRTDKKELEKQIQSLTEQINAEKTTQKNAWYFGAIQALEDAGFDSQDFKDRLNLTDLQIENAKRFRNRIRRFYPERKEMSYDQTSLIKKIEEENYTYGSEALEADFVFLSKDQAQELNRKIKGFIRTLKSKNQNNSSENLSLIYWGNSKLLKG